MKRIVHDTYVVYLILNYTNGEKKYVGITSRTKEERFKQHVYDALSPLKKKKTHLQGAIAKYGADAFDLFELETCAGLEHAWRREEYWIRHLSSHIPERGYNLTLGGDGVVPTDEIRRKMSASAKARTDRKIHPPEVCQKIVDSRRAGAGYGHTPEAIKKIAEGNRAWWTPERRKVQAERYTGSKSQGYRHDILDSEVIALYTFGFSLKAVSRLYGSESLLKTIRKRLRHNGIAIRPRTMKGTCS